jgi:hypothetical protein
MGMVDSTVSGPSEGRHQAGASLFVVRQFDLDQCAKAAFGIHSMMPKGGGLDASLVQAPLVDFQRLERLESGLLGLC